MHVESGFQLRDLKRHIRNRIRHFRVLTLQLENATISVQKGVLKHADLPAEKLDNTNDIGRLIPKKLVEHRVLFGSGEFVRKQRGGFSRWDSFLRCQFSHLRICAVKF